MAEGENISRIHQGPVESLLRLFQGKQTGPGEEFDRVTPPNSLPSNVDLRLARRRPTRDEAIRRLTPVEPPTPDGAA